MALKYQFFSANSMQIPTLTSIGCSSDLEETHFGPARRNQYLIHYVMSGKGYFNGNPVETGYGFLITPGMYEHYYADKDDPWSYLWIISDDPVMQNFFELYGANPNTGIFQFHNIYVVKNIADRLMASPNGICFSALQLTEYFLTIYNNCTYVSKNRISSNAKLYFDFSVNYINSFLHLPLHVHTLCEKLGISQVYLYKIFQNELGCSPKEYISRQKLLQAKKLLAETDFLISEIAASVGFADALAFSKFFSSAEKMSPSEYRKRNR